VEEVIKKVSIALGSLTVLVTDAKSFPDMGEIELGRAAVGNKTFFNVPGSEREL
jgi:hypothetical protein